MGLKPSTWVWSRNSGPHLQIKLTLQPQRTNQLSIANQLVVRVHEHLPTSFWNVECLVLVSSCVPGYLEKNTGSLQLVTLMILSSLSGRVVETWGKGVI